MPLVLESPSLGGSAWLSCNLSTQEVGAGGLEGNGLPQLHVTLKVNVGGKHLFLNLDPVRGLRKTA